MENSHIAWTDHTFNPWEGCIKVSDGCKNCYAENRDSRWHNGCHWGPNSPRKSMSDNYWKQPLKWNKTCGQLGIKQKVFCASLADVFEDNPQVISSRLRLTELIAKTPNLIWLILTKRPENINKLAYKWIIEGIPDNVWIGTSVENQSAANTRIPELLKITATVRFLSMEPLLGPVDITQNSINYSLPTRICEITNLPIEFTDPGKSFIGIDWVIVGGESGQNARPMNPQWARDIRDQCNKSNVPFFFKQNGEYVSVSEVAGPGEHYHFPDGRTVRKLGKKLSGDTLDGNEYKEFPNFK